MTYPSLLRPTATETFTVGGQPLLVPKAELRLRPWQGAPVADTFGGKPLVDFGGRPVFAELAVYELFRLSGWEARRLTYLRPQPPPVSMAGPRKTRGIAGWAGQGGSIPPR